ncbi:MAG TPA: hypothetical protein PLL30_16225 [Candidatus Krumholzibacteria bacterium]|nr:hypothetical protein [Candidatus Krumholzibacteria bacterium]HPD73318.1 hypothetical protein [Candidatus Krumholzibacteria bacterium]HRY42034.1 hypothetical protein [Candidatus Krumholzibacteria bacterium]
MRRIVLELGFCAGFGQEALVSNGEYQRDLQRDGRCLAVRNGKAFV